jgi:hypothetical protein
MASSLKQAGYELTDFSAHQLDLGDGYPDPMIPVARSADAANHAVARDKRREGSRAVGSWRWNHTPLSAPN